MNDHYNAGTTYAESHVTKVFPPVSLTAAILALSDVRDRKTWYHNAQRNDRNKQGFKKRRLFNKTRQDDI